LLGKRPGDAPGAGGHVEHQLATFERKHFNQLFRQRAPDPGHGAPIKVGCMRRIVEAGLVIVAVTMFVLGVRVPVGVIVIVVMAMGMIVSVLVAV
jgi:hypothetical protein